MPCQGRSGKSIFFEAIFVIGALVVVGHLSVNYWEKYFIQSEIAEVKTSLNHLKKTIADIGYAYDNLNRDMNGLTAYSITENLPSAHTPADDHKYRSKYTVDRRHSNSVKVANIITGQKLAKSNYKDNKTSDTVANANIMTNTNTKNSEGISTVVSKANAISSVKSTCIPKKTPAPKEKSTITTNTKPVVEVSTVATNINPFSDAKSTITTNTKPAATAKSTITTKTKPGKEVRTLTSNRKPVTDAKSTITTNTRAHVDAKSTVTTNTRPDVSTITSKIKTAEDVSTLTRHPLKSTAAGLCHQHDDCIHEHHCKHNNYHYCKDNPYDRHASNTLKF